MIVVVLSPGRPEIPLREVGLETLQKMDGQFFVAGETNAFSGLIIERYEEGGLKSRTTVENGILNGVSEGWHVNGQQQIREHFFEGVAQGRRTKWWPNGTKLSEGEVVEGEWEGVFRKWHESGQLSQKIPMKGGKAHGVAKAWFPSGVLKSDVELVDGETVKSQFFEEPEKSLSLSLSASVASHDDKEEP